MLRLRLRYCWRYRWAWWRLIRLRLTALRARWQRPPFQCHIPTCPVCLASAAGGICGQCGWQEQQCPACGLPISERLTVGYRYQCSRCKHVWLVE
jgi:hypothetical protein